MSSPLFPKILAISFRSVTQNHSLSLTVRNPHFVVHYTLVASLFNKVRIMTLRTLL